MIKIDEKLLQNAAAKAIEYLQTLESRKVRPEKDDLLKMLSFEETLSVAGTQPEDTLSFLHRFGSPATMASNGGRYFGFVIGGSEAVALAANWLTSAWDQNAGLAITSPVNAKIESVTERWLKELLPVSPASSIGFVTGVTMANFTALAAARTAILQRLNWDVEANGLFGAPAITVVVGEEAHGSLLKALSLLGLGRSRVVKVPTDRNGRMNPDQLPPLDARTILCLQAGNVNTGGMDNGSIIARAKAAGAWTHIDGAFGLWLGASTSRKHLTRGYELADSWATDGHKWLNVPYDSGLVICQDGQHLKRAMSMNGDYLDQTGERIPYHYTPELSRRARAIDIWATLRTLGRQGVDDLITRTCIHAERIADRLRKEGFEILNQVESNQVLVAFGNDAKTEEVIKGIQEEGVCWCSGTIWRNQSALRISVSSSKTTPDDIEKSLQSIVRVAKKK
jgi:glutamate/tyrosine decarboxylase-like PLP-dependent enzyme